MNSPKWLPGDDAEDEDDKDDNWDPKQIHNGGFASTVLLIVIIIIIAMTATIIISTTKVTIEIQLIIKQFVGVGWCNTNVWPCMKTPYPCPCKKKLMVKDFQDTVSAAATWRWPSRWCRGGRWQQRGWRRQGRWRHGRGGELFGGGTPGLQIEIWKYEFRGNMDFERTDQGRGRRPGQESTEALPEKLRSVPA